MVCKVYQLPYSFEITLAINVNNNSQNLSTTFRKTFSLHKHSQRFSNIFCSKATNESAVNWCE